METNDIPTAALLEVQIILERYLAYSLDAPDALHKILAIVDRPEVAHGLDSELPAPSSFPLSDGACFASFP
jgi:hypothetical protein